MHEIESEDVRRMSTPGIDSARMKVGQKYTCPIGRSILVNLLAYKFIIIFEKLDLIVR